MLSLLSSSSRPPLELEDDLTRGFEYSLSSLLGLAPTPPFGSSTRPPLLPSQEIAVAASGAGGSGGARDGVRGTVGSGRR